MVAERTSASNVDQVVLHVVQVVEAKRGSGEGRAVAAPTRTVPSNPSTPAYADATSSAEVASSSATRPGGCSPYRPSTAASSWSQFWNNGSSVSYIALTRVANTRCTSRTRQAYSSADHTPGSGRLATSARASTRRQRSAFARSLLAISSGGTALTSTAHSGHDRCRTQVQSFVSGSIVGSVLIGAVWRSVPGLGHVPEVPEAAGRMTS